MRTLKLAFRNIFRNKRRSLATIMAIAMSAIGMVLFGGFITNIFLAFHTDIVKFNGHFSVFKTGYFEYGAGKPAEYDIPNYEDVTALIKNDGVLKQYVRVATPVLDVGGIVHSEQSGRSKTFFGAGVVPSDKYEMSTWNGFDIIGPVTNPHELGMTDADENGGVLGFELAKLIKVCDGLSPSPCETDQSSAVQGQIVDSVAPVHDPASGEEDTRPTVNLLSSAEGAPNVVRMRVIRARVMGAREFDENFAMLPLALAQRLLYGRGEKHATSIQLQLTHPRYMPLVRSRLEALFRENDLDLEVKDFLAMWPQFAQVTAMFQTIFVFIAGVMGVVALFSISNTMSMCVMERVSEIGTLRSMGLRRRGVMLMFLLEGALLGVIGATVGAALGVGIAQFINASGLTWVPPTQVAAVPLTLLPWKHALLIPGTWAGLILAAALSSIAPANRGATMEVVDALRH